MPSPFPGMDPFLEDPVLWSDFHTSFYVAIKAELNRILPPGYIARIDRYFWLHEPDAQERVLLGKPDAFVLENRQERGEFAAPTTAQAPATVLLPAVRKQGNRYLKIQDVARRKVATVLEILSPSNKEKGPDRDAYLMKRNEYLATEVNLVAIDLLRSGLRMPVGEGELPPADYFVRVCRSWEFPRADLWPIGVRDALPSIPIPLIPDRSEPLLDLQACFNATFDEGRYDAEIDYSAGPRPPLAGEDRDWLRAVLEKSPTDH